MHCRVTGDLVPCENPFHTRRQVQRATGRPLARPAVAAAVAGGSTGGNRDSPQAALLDTSSDAGPSSNSIGAALAVALEKLESEDTAVSVGRRGRVIRVKPGRSITNDNGVSSDKAEPPGEWQEQPPPARQPCIPPLPYWCDAVAVVGLPGDQLVFRFMTPTAATAAQRRLIPVAEPFGAAAIKLALLSGQRAQEILDRWQYAVARGELAELDARAPLCWSYETAAKALGREPAAGSPPPAVDAKAERREAKRQRRVAKRLVEEQKRQAAQGSPAEAQSSGGAEPAPTKRWLSVPDSAFQAGWRVCTVRGQADGTLIFKFGDFEPLPDGMSKDQLSASEGDGDGGGLAAMKRLLLLQQQQGTQEGVPWSNTLRLVSRFPETAERALTKLSVFLEEQQQRGSSSVSLAASLFPSYQQALGRLEKRLQQLAAAQEAQESGEAGVQQEQRGKQRGKQQRQRKQAAAGSKGMGQPVRQRLAAVEKAEALVARQQERQDKDVLQAAAVAGAEVGEQPADSTSNGAAGGSQGTMGGADQRLEQEQEAAEQQPAAQEQAAPAQERLSRQQESQPRQATNWEQETGPETAAGSEQVSLLASLAATVALAVGAVGQLAKLVTAGLVNAWLALYRRLVPVRLRRLFWPCWPPQVEEAHVSPKLAALIGQAGSLDASALSNAGFDTQGQTHAPLADLPAWRIEALTLCRVRDMSLYRTALTHKSALPVELRLEKSYERLEFLGDSVLGLTCRTLLMRRCPNSDEGAMTRFNSVLVSGAANARYASWLGLDRYLLLDPKLYRDGMQHTPALLADTFEALLGAVYLDRGFAAAQRFCMRVLDACVDWEEVEAARDYKALLYRYALSKQVPHPRFEMQRGGPREYKAGLQLPWWSATVHFQGRVMGTGSSFDRRVAEQVAARDTLRKLGQLPRL